jgi:uncharacterized repeat protein (TIGR03806 family)
MSVEVFRAGRTKQEGHAGSTSGSRQRAIRAARPGALALLSFVVACSSDRTELFPPLSLDAGATIDGTGSPTGGTSAGGGAGAGMAGNDGFGGSASPVGDSNGLGGTGGAPSDAGIDATPDDSGNGIAPPLVVGLLERPEASAYLNLPARHDFKPRGWDVEEVFPTLSFTNATFITEAPTTGHLFITEREGRIYAVENRPDATEKKLVLDLSGQCQGRGDHGLLGITFHPEFGQPGSPNRGYFYLHYPYNNPAIVDGPVPATVPTMSRLSRFTLDLDTLQADPSSELVLIDQYDENTLHLGGASFFRQSDGYLYLTVGDEGLACSGSGNCGHIDKDLFSGVLRIDVDPNPDADSHAIPRQPESGTTANYTIPNDNPFVGQPGVLEEFYALGVRSPHRMTYDPTDDIVWIGDVGANTREELDVLQPGANYQWDSYEGFFRRHSPPDEVVGIWTDPVIDFPRNEFRTIIGGYVYRGQRFPELQGKYLFGDFWENSIWTNSYTYDGQHTELLETKQIASQVGGRGATLTSFGVDAAGELYVTSLGLDRIKTLITRAQASSNLPDSLAGLGVFADVPSLTPAAALIPYDVQNPLWSDGAGKHRWIALPSGTHITFAENGAWQFPAGTVLVKHFEMTMDERDSSSVHRLETRVLVAMEDGTYYGASYKWNSEGTAATLLLESQTDELDIVERDGSSRHQSYFYPGPRDCVTCHNAEAGFVLGVRTAQLNGEKLYDATGRVANQLYTWSELDMFDHRLADEDIRGYPQLAPLSDESRSQEERVRSYWDSNCSMCHGSVQGMRANWDARIQTPLGQQRVVGAPSVNTEGALIVAPGDSEASLLMVRDRSTDPDGRMPPLGRTRTDETYVELLRQWIESLGSESSTPSN